MVPFIRMAQNIYLYTEIKGVTMYLKIIDDSFSKYLLREVECLTNYGKIDVTKIKYNQISKTLHIPLNRYKILSDKSIFGIDLFKYDISSVQSMLILKNIENCSIENNFEESETEIRILLGIKIDVKKKEIQVISSAEDKGVTCFTLTAKYSILDLELSDMDEIIG